MLRSGRALALEFSRVAIRVAVPNVLSSPISTQPKLLDGVAIQLARSASRAALDGNVEAPEFTLAVEMTPAEKSPPALLQAPVFQNVLSHVASPGMAVVPAPPVGPASEAPSPQSFSAL